MKLLLALLVVTALAGCGPIVEEQQTPTILGSAAVVSTTTTSPGATPALAVTPEGGADLHDSAGGAETLTAHEGLAFPILEVNGSWYRIVDTCGREGWMDQAQVNTVPRSGPNGEPGPEFDLSSAVIVLDPGHGGRDLGAVGPAGTTEAEVNLGIADRLRDLLTSGHSIDWETGRIRSGTDYPAVEQVWLTRAPESPLEGDIELALTYRIGIASQVGADVFISIHNNSQPGVVSSTPGTDVFYSVAASGSDRLASLIHQELVRSLAGLGNEFGAARVTGARTRVEADGTDFYGLLRRGEQPTVIVEGLYISEPAEERILSTGVGRQAYADGVYRGLIRFLTTNEDGTTIHAPEVFDSDVGSATYDGCVVPAQP